MALCLDCVRNLFSLCILEPMHDIDKNRKSATVFMLHTVIEELRSIYCELIVSAIVRKIIIQIVSNSEG